VCVVSSPEKAELCRRMGAELIIDRSAEGYRFWKDENTQDQSEWRRFGERVRELTGGDDPDIVFEHPGRETFGVSVYVARKGGTIVTCASTSGYMHQFDNRYLWMNLKRIVGSHFANYREAWEANRLIAKGLIHPTLSQVYPMDRDRAGRVRRAPQRPPGQGRRPLPGARRGPGGPRHRPAGPTRTGDQPIPWRVTGRQRYEGPAPGRTHCRGRLDAAEIRVSSRYEVDHESGVPKRPYALRKPRVGLPVCANAPAAAAEHRIF
jgi:hypothetical protein